MMVDEGRFHSCVFCLLNWKETGHFYFFLNLFFLIEGGNAEICRVCELVHGKLIFMILNS